MDFGEHLLAKRLDRIEPFHVMAILARAKALEAQGKDIVHMEIGEPDFPSAQPIIDAGKAALDAKQTFYTPATGLPALRGAIADFYRSRYAVDCEAERIVVTPGASGALLLALSVILDVGDKVMLADPSYPCNKHFAELLNAEVIAVPVDASSRFQLTADLVKQHWQPGCKVVMLGSPSNPTGTIIAHEELVAIQAFLVEQGAVLIVDEIYQGLLYSGTVTPAFAIDDNIVVINSFSKYFGMTGWRVGWLVAPTWMVEALDRVAQNVFLAASTPAQYAALAALTPACLEILEHRRKVFEERRDMLAPALTALGFEIPCLPEGAFYLYANSSHLAPDSFQFCTDLLEKAGVAVTPGLDFGRHNAGDFVRFAYTRDIERLQEGVDRIAKYLHK